MLCVVLQAKRRVREDFDKLNEALVLLYGRCYSAAQGSQLELVASGRDIVDNQNGGRRTF